MADDMHNETSEQKHPWHGVLIGERSGRVKFATKIATFVFWIFGVFCIVQTAYCEVTLENVNTRGLATVYILIWATLPPIWFKIDNKCLRQNVNRNDLTLGQKEAAAMWAGFLGTILVLATR